MNYEDEDIILHQSPLDQYLGEVSDLSFEKYIPEINPPQSSDSVKLNETRYIFWFQQQLVSFLRTYMSVNSNDRFHLVESCYVLLNSEFMCEKDEKLLIELNEEVQNTRMLQNYKPHIPNKFMVRYVNFSVAALVLSICCAIFIRCKSLEDTCAWALFLFLICGCFYYWKTNTTNIPDELLNIVKIFVHEFRLYSDMVDKAIQHIKEVEIITHGYSHIFHKSHAHKCLGNGEKCMKLRNCIMDGLINLFNQLRVNVRIALGKHKSNMPYDYKEEYLATMPIDLFSAVFYSTSNEIHGTANVIPLDQIKSVVCLYRSQMSEFVYEMTVLLNALSSDNIQESTKDILFSIEDLNKLVKNTSASLDEQLNISLKLIFQKRMITTEKPESNSQTVEDILHSSELHLHSALRRVEDMKDLFGKNFPLEKQSLDVFNSLLSQFNLSIENAKYCMEDIGDKAQPNIIKVKLDSFDNHLDEMKDSDDVDYVLYKEPNTGNGDMLFEGESNFSIANECDISSIYEMENTVKDSKESQKLMRELKNVLSVKDSPVGLISFPLTIRSEEENKEDCPEEYASGSEIKKVEEMKDKKQYKCVYTNDGYQNDSECSGDEIIPNVQKMSLPKEFLADISLYKFGLVEETFGSSDDDDDVVGKVDSGIS